ncbi:MAG: hypothetical protein HWE21_13390 [Cytophagia bacterium]|nr:hypothetical protein [Cytophagia bacterium]
MDKERFSTLLQNPSKVTNADIKALNEYRKKYPYFQSLYVVVAKALREREHPKTDAFIKKAAIYSANRSHLKEIIEGDFVFALKEKEPKQEIPQKTVVETVAPPKVEEPKKVETPAATDTQKEVKQAEKAKAPKESKAETKVKLEEKKPEGKKEAKGTKQSVPKTEVTKTPVIDNDLAEIEATKRRIEALLSGQLVESEIEKKPKKPISEKKKNQIEIIEKFIKNEPQMDRERMAEAEGKVDIEDLADKSLLKEEDFETETLAKLMAKQGKVKKAEDIYKKLSLKFPEKSAYFATQIEKLK